MDIVNLWPVPVGVLELNRDFTEEEIYLVKNLERRPNQGNCTSCNEHLFNLPELKDLHDLVSEKLKEYVDETLAHVDEVELKITQSWANYTQFEQYHHQHIHPNSIISGVLYLHAYEELDSITFHKESKWQIEAQKKTTTHYNATSWWLPVKTGNLFLFPSDLSHSVGTRENVDTFITETKDNRISIAFNTFYTGVLGNCNTLTGLTIKEIF